jgi:hypothetical protein
LGRAAVFEGAQEGVGGLGDLGVAAGFAGPLETRGGFVDALAAGLALAVLLDEGLEGVHGGKIRTRRGDSRGFARMTAILRTGESAARNLRR